MCIYAASTQRSSINITPKNSKFLVSIVPVPDLIHPPLQVIEKLSIVYFPHIQANESKSVIFTEMSEVNSGSSFEHIWKTLFRRNLWMKFSLSLNGSGENWLKLAQKIQRSQGSSIHLDIDVFPCFRVNIVSVPCIIRQASIVREKLTFQYFSYACIGKQIWPSLKKVKDQPRVILRTDSRLQ